MLRDGLGIRTRIVIGIVVGIVMWIGIGVEIASSPKAPKTIQNQQTRHSKILQKISTQIRIPKELPFVVLITP